MFFLQLGLGAKRKAGFNGDKNPPRRKTKTQMHGMNRKMALSLVVIGEWSQCEERAKGSLSAGSRGNGDVLLSSACDEETGPRRACCGPCSKICRHASLPLNGDRLSRPRQDSGRIPPQLGERSTQQRHVTRSVGCVGFPVRCSRASLRSDGQQGPLFNDHHHSNAITTHAP
ncbi:hypothetical protein GW17_00043594 [Ensete ventricosum]|nr:hypothetical protein GW17_00043594 [Ensete ventricosum]